MVVCEVSNLVKRYGEFMALDHLNLSIEKGEVFGFLGPNGSGKTTAINCILQLLTYDKGEIKLFGQPMTSTSYELKRRIGVIPQDVAIVEELTVRENIDFFCGLYVHNSAQRKTMVEEAIDFVGLQDFTRFRPQKLSGGLKRRLNIACGIAHKPELIFFDEPTVAVDPQSRNSILEGILHLNTQGTTVVYTSHYMEEVEQICSRIMIMDHGQTIACGSNTELKAMVETGEKIQIDTTDISDAALEALRNLDCVARAEYNSTRLNVFCKNGAHNLSAILSCLQNQDITFGRIYSEPPTLNDVFLEMTGKELRD